MDELRTSQARFNTLDFLRLTLLIVLSSVAVQYSPSLGIFLMAFSLGVFLGRLNVYGVKKQFLIHAIISMLAIVATLALEAYIGGTILEMRLHSLATCLVAAIPVFVTGLYLKAILRYSVMELLTALSILLLVFAFIIYYSSDELWIAWWAFASLGGMVLLVIVFPFTIAIYFVFLYDVWKSRHLR